MSLPKFEHIQEEIANMLAIPDEELDEEQRQLMDAYLNELGAQEAGKVDGFASFLKVQAAFVEACKNEAERLKAKADTAARRIEWFKSHYLQTMQKHGIRKIKGNAYTISVRNSEAVEVTDMEALRQVPDMVKETVIISTDRAAIKSAIKKGIVVPGAELVTRQSLQVR